MTAAADTVQGSNRFWTVSNMLSLSRIVLSIPFMLVMLLDVPGARWWGLAILAVGIATDKLDGVLARKRNEISEWGKILDPLGDKVGLGAVALVLVLQNVLPLWFLLLLVGRDLLIFVGGIYLRSISGSVLPSNVAGKWTVGVVAGYLLLKLLGIEGLLTDIGLTASVLMILISFASYAFRFFEVLRFREGAHGNP